MKSGLRSLVRGVVSMFDLLSVFSFLFFFCLNGLLVILNGVNVYCLVFYTTWTIGRLSVSRSFTLLCFGFLQ